MRTTSPKRPILDLPLRFESTQPGHAARLHKALRAAILDGRLAPGQRLPSSRSLAGQFGIARTAVVLAYEHLQGDGLVEARHGSGSFVAAGLAGRERRQPAASYAPPPTRQAACAVGRTEADPILMRQFATIMRRRIIQARPEDLAYGDPRGSGELRGQIAAHLAASRGFHCDPDSILVLGGTQHGLRLFAEATLRAGDAVWFEEPGYATARRTLISAGLNAVAVPVDRDGIDVAAGRRRAAAARAAYVTPSNQFPSGATMSMSRRLALLDWAREADAWILEDDYDNEFRYDGTPLTALAGLDGGERVVYLGTFSKTLFPSLRLAYMVLPSPLVGRIVNLRLTHDRFPPGLTQAAIAELMATGALAHHTRRMRRRYGAMRDVLAATLTEAAGAGLDVVVPSQGLHIVAWLSTGHPAGAAAAIREAAGIEGWMVSEHRMEPGGRDGLVLGFAGHGEEELRLAGRRLGEAAARFAGR